jgi:hypothetical protein
MQGSNISVGSREAGQRQVSQRCVCPCCPQGHRPLDLGSIWPPHQAVPIFLTRESCVCQPAGRPPYLPGHSGSHVASWTKTVAEGKFTQDRKGIGGCTACVWVILQSTVTGQSWGEGGLTHSVCFSRLSLWYNGGNGCLVPNVFRS